MIKSFTIINYLGDQLKLDLGGYEKSGLLIKSVSGLGPGKADVNTTNIATQDGAKFTSARLPKRDIQFKFIFVQTETETVEDIRQKTYKYFPLKHEITIRIETDTKILKIKGRVEQNDPDIFSKEEGATVTIVCPDPRFYTGGADNVTYFSGVAPMFEFPFSNESLTEPLLDMGEIKIDTSGTIKYDGDDEIGMVIKMHAVGSASGIRIYNLTSKEVMAIDSAKLSEIVGSDIVAQDDIIIDTRKGEKSVTLLRGGVEYNILNTLSRNTAWLGLSKGNNTYAFTAEEGLSNLQFTITNQTLYEGV